MTESLSIKWHIPKTNQLYNSTLWTDYTIDFGLESGGWESLPWHWRILLILLETSWRINTKTCTSNYVFQINGLISGPEMERMMFGISEAAAYHNIYARAQCTSTIWTV